MLHIDKLLEAARKNSATGLEESAFPQLKMIALKISNDPLMSLVFSVILAEGIDIINNLLPMRFRVLGDCLLEIWLQPVILSSRTANAAFYLLG